jgi:hypothetical protein
MADARNFGDPRIMDAYKRPTAQQTGQSMVPGVPSGPSYTPAPVNGTFATSGSYGTPSLGVPGGAAYGRPYENGPTLSPNLIGRYAPTERFNYFEVRGNNSSSQGGWVSIAVERPTLLVPVSQLFGSVYFAPHAIPSTVGTNNALLNAERAEGPGVCYLWAPGTWWVKYDASNTLRAQFRQMSAEDPAIVAAAMSMPGCQKVSNNASPYLLTASMSTLIANANVARRALVVQVTSTGVSISKPIYIALNGNASPTIHAYALTSPYQSITFADEAMNTGIVHAYTDLATEQLQVTEYE